MTNFSLFSSKIWRNIWWKKQHNRAIRNGREKVKKKKAYAFIERLKKEIEEKIILRKKSR